MRNYRVFSVDKHKPRKKKIFRINSKKYGGQRAALRSFKFVGKVGGVDFEAAAQPGGNLRVENISLDYDKDLCDGLQLEIIVNGESYRPFLPNWLLVPTVLYADDQYTAIVSLFGEDSSTDNHSIVYHPSMVDTLLGLRMLQADILLMGKSPGGLPKSEGQSIVGLGEHPLQDFAKAKIQKKQIEKRIKDKKVQSWVMTDLDVDVRFTAKRDPRNPLMQIFGVKSKGEKHELVP